MKALWQDEVSEHHGEHYDLPACRLYPKPVQTPHPPIHVGGESKAALRRVAKHGQGWYTFNRQPHELAEPLAQLEGLLAEQGRSRSDIELTVCPYFQPVTAETIAAYEAAGVDRLVLLFFAFEESAIATTMDDLAALLP
jgi:alkanesulfonate monooxygenase SsuD/methylene tetrahydromethanopterin reductase-like flavin-dependent oxidoreductase (luciferase family)